ncbi:MAG: hypothetical protein KDI51_04410, partial [Xanthomonadales bacterium]|nr:hypothetical protein [Xanthomonadales bacterium]
MVTRTAASKSTPVQAGARAVMAAPRFAPEQKLELGQVLNALLDDGLLNKEQANQVRLAQRPGQVDLHPLVMIANLKLDHAGERGKKLTLELLTEWLAAQVQLPYMKLDPMKIDMSRVTDIIGQAYAQRYRILPIEVNEYEV